MKKFLFIALAIVSSMVFTSCGTQFGLVYGVQLTGDGDGQFEVTFPQGSYEMNGKAALALNVGDSVLFNDTTAKVAYKKDVLLRGNQKEIEAMRRVNDSIANQFNAFDGEGTYDIWLKGFVKEIGTGLVFSVDRHFTNRMKAVRKNDNDLYPFIQ